MTDGDAQNVQIVRSLVAAGQLSDAARFCEDCLRAAAPGPTAFILRALLLTTAGELNEAVAQYEEALALAPDALPAYMGIADILARKGWLSSARVVLENARRSTIFTAEAQEQISALERRRAETIRIGFST